MGGETLDVTAVIVGNFGRIETMLIGVSGVASGVVPRIGIGKPVGQNEVDRLSGSRMRGGRNG